MSFILLMLCMFNCAQGSEWMAYQNAEVEQSDRVFTFPQSNGAKILSKVLSDKGFGYVDEKTDIANALNGYTVSRQDLEHCIEGELARFCSSLIEEEDDKKKYNALRSALVKIFLDVANSDS